MALSDNIKRFRELKNLSVPDLAEKMGIDKAGIYKWEDGSVTPGGKSLTAIAEALGVTVNDLLMENNTRAEIESAIPEKPLRDDTLGIVRSLLEMEKVGNYMFLPKSVLEGDYRLSLKSERDETIATFKKLVSNLEGEVADLRQRIAILTAPTKKAK